MFVVHFVSPTNGYKIAILRISKNLKALMNENVVNEKVGKTVNRNPKTDPKKEIEIIL